jgi:signal transduction histidine kinase
MRCRISWHEPRKRCWIAWSTCVRSCAARTARRWRCFAKKKALFGSKRAPARSEGLRGRTIQRQESPCSVCLDKNAPQLLLRPFAHFPRLQESGTPELAELLVVPLYADSRAVGTLWVAQQHEGPGFDSEDVRVLQSLADFTAASWRMTALQHALSRANAELEDAHRRKDHFFTTLCHELKTPLGAIVNALDLIKAGNERAWAMEVMRSQAAQLAHLLDDVQDVARVTQGKMQLRRQVTLLQESVETAVLTVTHLMEERRHTLTVAMPDEPLHLLADPPRLTQILVNLLANAARYTEPGGMVRIGAEHEGEEVVVRVSDTGTGIRPELASGIFDLYAQGATGTRGLGIGLSLVRGLVRLHGGSIQVLSAGAGQGSEFTVRLPTGRMIDPAVKQPHAELGGLVGAARAGP